MVIDICHLFASLLTRKYKITPETKISINIVIKGDFPSGVTIYWLMSKSPNTRIKNTVVEKNSIAAKTAKVLKKIKRSSRLELITLPKNSSKTKSIISFISNPSIFHHNRMMIFYKIYYQHE